MKLVANLSLPAGHPDRVRLVELTPEDIAQRELDEAAALVPEPTTPAPVSKLAAFLAANPDVAALINGDARPTSPTSKT